MKIKTINFKKLILKILYPAIALGLYVLCAVLTMMQNLLKKDERKKMPTIKKWIMGGN